VNIGDFVETRCRIDGLTKSVIFVSDTAFVGARIVATATDFWRVILPR